MAASKAQATEGLPVLTAEQLLAADDRPEKAVEVEAWGGSVKIKALSLGQFMDIQTEAASATGEVDQIEAAVQMLVHGLVEPKLDTKQAVLLKDKNMLTVMELVGEIASLSGIDISSIQAAEARFPDEQGG